MKFTIENVTIIRKNGKVVQPGPSVRFSIFELSAQADEYFQVSAIKDPKNFFLREAFNQYIHRIMFVHVVSIIYEFN